MNAHVRRYHQHHHTLGEGHIWQGRFKAFPIEADEHLLAVLRYVERNPVRAKLVERAEAWAWSSLPEATGLGTPGATKAPAGRPAEPGAPSGDAVPGGGSEPPEPLLHACPVPRPANWLTRVNQAESKPELAAIQKSVKRGTPYGGDSWVRRTAGRLGLGHTLRERGRPRKTPEKGVAR